MEYFFAIPLITHKRPGCKHLYTSHRFKVHFYQDFDKVSLVTFFLEIASTAADIKQTSLDLDRQLSIDLQDILHILDVIHHLVMQIGSMVCNGDLAVSAGVVKNIIANLVDNSAMKIIMVVNN